MKELKTEDKKFVDFIHESLVKIMEHKAANNDFSDYKLVITLEDVKIATNRTRVRKANLDIIGGALEELGYDGTYAANGQSVTIVALSPFAKKKVYSYNDLMTRARLIDRLKQ